MRGSMSVMGAFSCALLGIVLTQASGQVTKPPTGWTPDAALVKQLGAAVALENYNIRVPKGYEMQPINHPPGMKMWGWAGEARKDGTRPTITLYQLTFPAAERERNKNLSLEQVAEKLVGGEARRRTNRKLEKTEKGVINGMDFARVRWEGIDSSKKWTMRGIVYVARDGDSIIQIASQDLAPDSEKSLPLAEASAQTFKKK